MGSEMCIRDRGDSNMAEPTMALKVGSTLLILEMLEAGFELPEFDIEKPIHHIRAIARDMTGLTELPLAGGGSVTALEVQQQLCQRATQWLEEREDAGTPTAEMRRVVDLWQRTLHAIETQDFSGVDREIDWVIKLGLLERYRARLGGHWDHPKLAQIDMTYHDIRPSRGLYHVLLRKGLIERWITDSEIERAMDTAPATTRAALRGQFLAAARSLGANVTVDWTRLKVNRPEPRTEELLDPFVADDDRVEALLDYMRLHHS